MSAERPVGYFITFSCYGTHPRGHERGSIDRSHNHFGEELFEPSSLRATVNHDQQRYAGFLLGPKRREIVLRSALGVCRHRGWRLWALHARKTHVHAVISASVLPKRILGDLKRYASRELTQAGTDPRPRRFWSRGGSCRYLWEPDDLEAAVVYVALLQGSPMARYLAPELIVDEEYDSVMLSSWAQTYS